ncbi:hypothetical protein [Schleiferilactobacillus shenzhenensis]|nr:hypothetical protein [Schleiferilactobacillus shenzhenensis]
MKKILISLFGAALLGAGALTAIVPAQAQAADSNGSQIATQTKFTTQGDLGVVTTLKATDVYTDNTLSKPTGRTIAKGTRWRYDLIGMETGSMGTYPFAYRIGTNVWIPANAVSPNSYLTEGSVWTKGIVQISNKAGAKVYNDAYAMGTVTRTLPYGSRWQSARAVLDSHGDAITYQVGHTDFVKSSDVVLNPQPGIFTVTRLGAQTMINGVTGTKPLPKNSRWRTFGARYIGGNLSYKIATNTYIFGVYGTWTPTK